MSKNTLGTLYMISGKDILNESYRAILIVALCFVISMLGRKLLNVRTGFPTTAVPLLKVAGLFTLSSITLQAMEANGWIPGNLKN